MLKRHERDPSLDSNNSADVADHDELGCCVRTAIGTTQRCGPHSCWCARFRRVVIRYKPGDAKVHDAFAAAPMAVTHSHYRRALIASAWTNPNTAQFDKDKNYGDFAIARGDTLENVVIEPGKEIVVDIPSHPRQRALRLRHNDATRPIAGASRFPNTIVTAIAARAAATSRSSAAAGGILTIRTFSKATIRSKATSCS
jgi:hypothetical protein